MEQDNLAPNILDLIRIQNFSELCPDPSFDFGISETLLTPRYNLEELPNDWISPDAVSSPTHSPHLWQPTSFPDMVQPGTDAPPEWPIMSTISEPMQAQVEYMTHPNDIDPFFLDANAPFLPFDLSHPWPNLISESSDWPSPTMTGSQPIFQLSQAPAPIISSLGPPISEYPCAYCPKILVKKHLLNRHEKQHLKPVTCPVPLCGHCTASNRDMQRHIVVHHPGHNAALPPSPTNTYTCPFAGCRFNGMGFKRKDNLKRHCRTVHRSLNP